MALRIYDYTKRDLVFLFYIGHTNIFYYRYTRENVIKKTFTNRNENFPAAKQATKWSLRIKCWNQCQSMDETTHELVWLHDLRMVIGFKVKKPKNMMYFMITRKIYSKITLTDNGCHNVPRRIIQGFACTS